MLDSPMCSFLSSLDVELVTCRTAQYEVRTMLGSELKAEQPKVVKKIEMSVKYIATGVGHDVRRSVWGEVSERK